MVNDSKFKEGKRLSLEEVKKALHTTLEDFINNTPTLYRRGQIRTQEIVEDLYLNYPLKMNR